MTLTGYLTRLFLARVSWFLLGFSGLMLVLDLLDRATDVLARDGGDIPAILRYAGLRLPGIANQILPLAVLLGALTTLLSLAKHNEVIVLKSAGVSFFRLLGMLVPAAALMGAAQFMIADQVLPRTDRAFYAWWESTAPPADRDAPKRTWLRIEDTVAAFGRIALDGRSAEGVALFRRDDAGLLVERIAADRADWEDGRWVLSDVRRYRIGVAGIERVPSLVWETVLRPRDLADTAIQGVRHSVRQLRQLVGATRIGAETVSAYMVELHKKFATPVALLLMLLIAAPVAQGLHRHRAKGLQLTLGIAVGFAYLLVDGVVALLGESGLVTPLFAAWAPMLLFAGVGASIMLAVER